MRHRLHALLFLASVTLAGRVPAQCLDWTPGSHLTGIDGEVRASAVFDDGSGSGPELYVGGRFQAAGSVAAQNIAKWNGTRWAAVGGGRPGIVNGLHVWDDGGGPALWAGSDLGSPVFGDATLTLAKWDGSAWTQAGGSATIQYGPRALISYDDGSGDALYVTGRFSTVSGAPLVFPHAVARYRAGQWSALGAGIATDSLGAATLAVHDDGSGPRLFVGGYNLRPTPSGPASPVFTWDGASWTSNSAGYLFAGTVRSFAERATGTGTFELYASGYQTTSFSDTSLMRWNGAGWQSVGGTIVGDVQVLLADRPASGPGVVYVGGPAWSFGGVGAYGLAAWDGTQYAAIGPSLPYPAAPRHLALFDEGAGERLFAAGPQYMGIATDATGIVRFDGSQWTTVDPSVGHLVSGVLLDLESVQGGATPGLYAAGNFDGNTFSTGLRVGRWDGHTLVPVGATFLGTPRQLETFDDGVNGPQLFACGDFTSIGGYSINRVARWDGTFWQPLGSGISLVNGGAPALNAMATFDVGAGPRLAVAGKFDLAGGVVAQRIAAWDGTSWSKLGAGLDDQVLALAEYDDGSGRALYAGGSFVLAGLTSIARWDGTAWTGLGSGVNGAVSVLSVHDDGNGPALYAAGGFTVAGGQPAAGLARWNGTGWQAFGAGVSGVRALASFDDGSGAGPRLLAAGTFAVGGVTTAAGVAVWDGAAWQPLGLGLDSAPSALAAHDDGGNDGPALFAAGGFTRAGSHASARIARWARSGAAGCTASTGAAYCAGDGSGAACPCGNFGAPGRGCENSSGSGGARLRAEGQAMLSGDSVTLRVEGTTPAGAMLFFQGTTQPVSGSGFAFGDGLRCVGGQQYRLVIRAASAGMAAFGHGVPGDPPVSIAGNLAGGDWSTRHYQVWYRDAQAYCTSATFNLSNGVKIRWAP